MHRGPCVSYSSSDIHVVGVGVGVCVAVAVAVAVAVPSPITMVTQPLPPHSLTGSPLSCTPR